MTEIQDKDDNIKLDFAGQIFTVSRKVLAAQKGSYFETILKGCPDTDDGRYIVGDRDPALFKHILNYFQEIPLTLDTKVLQQLKEDAEYYRLPGLSHYLNYLSVAPKLDDEPGFRFAPGPNYSVTADGLEISKTNKSEWDATAVTNPIPSSGVHYLKLKLFNSKDGSIMIGVSPSTINQTQTRNFVSCGCYFSCYDGKLYAAKLCNVSGKSYYQGPALLTGREVGVKMDMTQRLISFTVDGQDKGVAYTDVPVDERLCFCVLLMHPTDTVRIIE